MKLGEQYWTIYYNQSTGFEQAVKATFTNDMTDRKRKREGRIFSSEQEANAYLKSIRG